MTMTPPPGGSTPTPPPPKPAQPAAAGTDALRGFLAGNGPWFLCLLAPVALAGLALLFVNSTRLANWWLSKENIKNEEKRIKLEGTRLYAERTAAEAKKERFRIQNEIRHQVALETDRAILQLDQATGKKHESVGEDGSKVLRILLNPCFAPGFTVKEIRHAASYNAGVKMRFTERYLQIIRHTEENQWPALVFNERTYLCERANTKAWNWESRPRWLVTEVTAEDFNDPHYLFKRCKLLYHPPLRMFNSTEPQQPKAEGFAQETPKHLTEIDHRLFETPEETCNQDTSVVQ